MIKDIYSQRIVVAPLHWGLGHATRCIPIIHNLIKQDNTLAIASDGDALQILRCEFPDLKFYDLPPYDITYRHPSMMANMISQGYKIYQTYLRELVAAQNIAFDFGANILISDNRLGFRSGHTHNVYLTHQLTIPSNNWIIRRAGSQMHRHFIDKFDACWILDHESDLAIGGLISKGNLDIPKIYLGPISRFKKTEGIAIKFDFAIILSGPEPQRSMLESRLLSFFEDRIDLKVCLVRGTSQKNNINPKAHIEVYELLGSADLNHILLTSEKLISRSGYTTIMDLLAISKGAILVPTPGQYEQEYLAKTLNGKYGFVSIPQDLIDKELPALL